MPFPAPAPGMRLCLWHQPHDPLLLVTLPREWPRYMSTRDTREQRSLLRVVGTILQLTRAEIDSVEARIAELERTMVSLARSEQPFWGGGYSKDPFPPPHPPFQSSLTPRSNRPLSHLTGCDLRSLLQCLLPSSDWIRVR